MIYWPYKSIYPFLPIPFFKLPLLTVPVNLLSNIPSFSAAVVIWLLMLLIFGAASWYLHRFKRHLNGRLMHARHVTERYRLYFLTLAVYLPVSEFVFELFKIRPESELESNVLAGMLSLILFLGSKQEGLLRKNIYPLFVSTFTLCIGWTFYRLLEFHDSIVYVSEFTLQLMFAYYAFIRVRDYLLTAAAISLVVLLLTGLNYFDVSTFVVLQVIIVITAGLNFSRHLIDSNTREKMLMAFSATEAGSLFMIGVDADGQIQYMSENCSDLFSGIDDVQFKPLADYLRISPENARRLIEPKGYSQMSTLSDRLGKDRYVLWQRGPESHSVVLLIGSEITDSVHLRHELQRTNQRLEKLLQHSGDVVIVLDRSYQITEFFDLKKDFFTGKSSEIIHRGLEELELDAENTKLLINALDSACLSKRILQIQLAKQSHATLFWYDVKIAALEDENGYLSEIVCTLRDITEFKEKERIKEQRAKRIEIYNRILVELSSSRYESFGTYDEACTRICKIAAQSIGATRVSLWEYKNQVLTLTHSSRADSLAVQEAQQLLEKDYPVYFDAIRQGMSIVASDARQHPHTAEFNASYFQKLDIRSTLDIPIRSDGMLRSIICCEMAGQQKIWSQEDESFVRMLGDLLAILHEQHRQKKEQELWTQTQTEQNRMRQLLDFGMWTLDLKNQSVVWNDTLYDVLAWPHDQEVQPDSLLSLIESPAERIQLQQALEDLTAYGRPIETPITLKTGSGHTKPFLLLCQAEFDNGVCIRQRGSLQNIESITHYIKLKSGDASFEILNNTLHDVLWVYDYTAERYQFYSRGSHQLLGLTPDELLKNPDTFKKLIHPHDVDLVEKAILKSRTAPQQELRYRLIVQGKEFEVLEKRYTLFNETGEALHCCGMIQTIPSPLNHSTLSESQHNDAKSFHADFMNKLIVEIQQPLYGTLGLTEMISSLDLNEDQKQYIENLKASSNQSLLLMNNVEDLFQLNNHSIEITPVPTHLHRLVDEMQVVMRFAMESHQIEFTCALDDSMSKRPVLLDAARIRQILLSILHHAVRNLYQARLHLLVSPENPQKPDAGIRFELLEYRNSFTSEDMSRLQVALPDEYSVNDKKVRDTGLGLHVSHRLLNMMHSGLFIEGIPNQGFRYSFVLHPEQGTPGASEQDTAADASQQEPDQIIILAESNPVNLFFAKSILNRLRPEYTVLESRNLDELKTQMQKSRPKLLILDVSLLNGQITHMRQIREWEKHRIHYVPVIATTSLSPDEAARYCRESGMDDFISKPVKAATLENILDTWIPVHTKTQETARSANQEPSVDFERMEEQMQSQKNYPNFFMPFIREALQDYLKELYTHFVNHDMPRLHGVAKKLQGMAQLGCFSRLEELTRKLIAMQDYQEEEGSQILSQLDNEIERILSHL